MTTITWAITALSVFDPDDRLWYPHVRVSVNGVFNGEYKYLIGAADEETALIMAKSLRDEEEAMIRAGMEREVASLSRKSLPTLPHWSL